MSSVLKIQYVPRDSAAFGRVYECLLYLLRQLVLCADDHAAHVDRHVEGVATTAT